MLNSYLLHYEQHTCSDCTIPLPALRQAEAKARRWVVPSKTKPLRIAETTETECTAIRVCLPSRLGGAHTILLVSRPPRCTQTIMSCDSDFYKSHITLLGTLHGLADDTFLRCTAKPSLHRFLKSRLPFTDCDARPLRCCLRPVVRA